MPECSLPLPARINLEELCSRNVALSVGVIDIGAEEGGAKCQGCVIGVSRLVAKTEIFASDAEGREVLRGQANIVDEAIAFLTRRPKFSSVVVVWSR